MIRATWPRATENQRPDIARLVLFQCSIREYYNELLIGFMLVVLFLSVLLIATFGKLSWRAL